MSERKLIYEEYSVNEENGVVVCILNVAVDSALEYINRHFMRSNLKIYYTKYNLKETIHMPTKFIGVTKCSEHDEFDIETGKRIARQRAMEKYQRSLWKRIRHIYDSLTVAMIEMEGKLFF